MIKPGEIYNIYIYSARGPIFSERALAFSDWAAAAAPAALSVLISSHLINASRRHWIKTSDRSVTMGQTFPLSLSLSLCHPLRTCVRECVATVRACACSLARNELISQSDEGRVPTYRCCGRIASSRNESSRRDPRGRNVAWRVLAATWRI